MPVQCGWSRSSPPVTSSWGSRFVLLMFFPLGCLKQLLKMELLPHFERVLSLPPCFSVGFWCCSPPPLCCMLSPVCTCLQSTQTSGVSTRKCWRKGDGAEVGASVSMQCKQLACRLFSSPASSSWRISFIRDAVGWQPSLLLLILALPIGSRLCCTWQSMCVSWKAAVPHRAPWGKAERKQRRRGGEGIEFGGSGPCPVRRLCVVRGSW